MRYSDVYSFGKMCCNALFKTTEPKDRHWEMVQEGIRKGLKKLMDQCREEELEHRLPNFEPVLKVLEALDPSPVPEIQKSARPGTDFERPQGEKEAAEDRQESVERPNQEEAGRKLDWGALGREAERQRREKEEKEARQKAEQEAAELRQAGELKLAQFVREALDRTQGKPTHNDSAAAKEIYQKHGLSTERAKQVVDDVKEKWKKSQAEKEEQERLSREREETERRKKPGEIITNSIGMKFVWIPPGSS